MWGSSKPLLVSRGLLHFVSRAGRESPAMRRSITFVN